MQKTKIPIMIFSLLFLTTGCIKENTEAHSKEEMLNTIDNLDCSYEYYYPSDDAARTTDNTDYNCNLKGKYSVISEEIIHQFKYEEHDARVITLKLNDYDFEFHIESSLRPIGLVTHSYTITTDYIKMANEYFSKKFNEENPSAVCNSEKIGNTKFCVVKKYDDISTVSKYIKSYVEYLNGLDIRFFDPKRSMSVYFGEKPNGGWYGISYKPKLVDGKYVLFRTITDETHKVIAENMYDSLASIEQDILSYVKENNIF